jgi:nitrogen fixation protein FixH
MTERKKSSIWGIGAFVGYGAFVVFVLAMVMYASIQNVELVENRPYEKGLAYQDRIDRLNRTAALDSSVTFEPRMASQTLLVRFPGLAAGVQVQGELRLLRPSNEHLDQHWALTLDPARSQEISIAGLARGLWRIEVDWTVDSAAYFYQSKLVIP